MRTIDESTAILERWRAKTGGYWEPRVGWILVFFSRKRQSLDYVRGTDNESSWHAAADWALQDCPEIGECVCGICPECMQKCACGRDIRRGAKRCRTCLAQLKPAAPKYPAFRCSRESAMDQLRRVRDRGGPFLCMGPGHDVVFDCVTFEALVAHCAEHGLDVSEFRDGLAEERAKPVYGPPIENAPVDSRCPGCEECTCSIDQVGKGSPCAKCRRPNSGKKLCLGCCNRNGTTVCVDCCPNQAALRARLARAEAAERTLARYPGYALGDLKAEHVRLNYENVIAKAEWKVQRRRMTRKEWVDAIDRSRDLDALDDAIRWLEKGKPR